MRRKTNGSLTIPRSILNQITRLINAAIIYWRYCPTRPTHFRLPGKGFRMYEKNNSTKCYYTKNTCNKKSCIHNNWLSLRDCVLIIGVAYKTERSIAFFLKTRAWILTTFSQVCLSIPSRRRWRSVAGRSGRARGWRWLACAAPTRRPARRPRCRAAAWIAWRAGPPSGHRRWLVFYRPEKKEKETV